MEPLPSKDLLVCVFIVIADFLIDLSTKVVLASSRFYDVAWLDLHLVACFSHVYNTCAFFTSL